MSTTTDRVPAGTGYVLSSEPDASWRSLAALSR